MKTNRFRIYCGPTLVKPLTELLEPHTDVYVMGTAHLHVQTYRTANELVNLLNSVSSGFRLRDVQFLP